MRYIVIFFFCVIQFTVAATPVVFSYYEAPNDTMTIEDIKNKPFQILDTDSISKGFNFHTFWIKFSVSPSDSIEKQILYLNNPTLDYVDFYQDKQHIKSTGDRRSDLEKDTLGYAFVIDMQTPHTYYLKLKTDSGLFTSLSLNPPHIHQKQIEYEKIFLTFFFGFLFSITLYNAFLYITLREKVYLYYVTFQVSTFLLFLSYSGMGYYLLWQGNSLLNEIIYQKGEILSLFFALLFAQTFLNTKEHFTYLNKAINLTLLLLLYILFTPWQYHGWLFQTTLIWTVVLGFFIVGHAIRKKIQDATLFFVATFSVLLGTLLVFLKIFGIMEVNLITTWAVYFGSMFEALLFSIALANRITLLKKREQTLIQEQKEILEREVDKQTISLRNMVSEKETLLKEINHRVKNNLQIISSFVSFASLQSEDKKTLQALDQRIHAISLLYSSLYKPDSSTVVNMHTYIEHIVQEIFRIYTPRITLNLDIQDIELDFDKAITVGLLVNEIITNMIIHAFENVDHATIQLYLGHKNQEYLLEIKDNGIGFDTNKQYESLGLKLIKRLSEKQLKGSLQLTSNASGSVFYILFG